MRNDAALRHEILSALSSLDDVGLPAFEPDRERARAFVRTWTGFVIR
jgi:hypothetical protein